MGFRRAPSQLPQYPPGLRATDQLQHLDGPYQAHAVSGRVEAVLLQVVQEPLDPPTGLRRGVAGQRLLQGRLGRLGELFQLARGFLPNLESVVIQLCEQPGQAARVGGRNGAEALPQEGHCLSGLGP